MVRLEKAKARYKDLEDDAHAELSGEALTNKLDELQLEKQHGLGQVQREHEAKAREDEVRLRQSEEEKFFKEKEDLVRKDHQRKRALLE